MTLEQIKGEVSRLELSQKLLLVEDVWDSIAASNSELSIPEPHKKELDKRYQEYQEGKLELHDWKTVHDELREKYK